MPESYLDAVRAVTAELVHSRLMLPQEADKALESARSGTRAKLAK